MELSWLGHDINYTIIEIYKTEPCLPMAEKNNAHSYVLTVSFMNHTTNVKIGLSSVCIYVKFAWPFYRPIIFKILLVIKVSG